MKLINYKFVVKVSVVKDQVVYESESVSQFMKSNYQFEKIFRDYVSSRRYPPPSSRENEVCENIFVSMFLDRENNEVLNLN